MGGSQDSTIACAAIRGRILSAMHVLLLGTSIDRIAQHALYVLHNMTATEAGRAAIVCDGRLLSVIVSYAVSGAVPCICLCVCVGGVRGCALVICYEELCACACAYVCVYDRELTQCSHDWDCSEMRNVHHLICVPTITPTTTATRVQ